MSYFSEKLSTILEYDDILLEAISDDILIRPLKASTIQVYTQNLETLKNSPSFARSALVRGHNNVDDWVANTRWTGAPRGLIELGDLSEEELLAILEYIKSNVPDKHMKFLRYWVDQIAKGNFNGLQHTLVIDTNGKAMLGVNFADDSIRLSDTIDKFDKAKRKQNWEHSPNLYDYNDWRKLEYKLTDFNVTVEDEKGSHSTILFTKEISLGSSNAKLMAQILGSEIEETPVKEYWLRQVFTPEAAEKYGKGTQWCTTNQRTAAGYLMRDPIYIIETSGGQHTTHEGEVRTSRRPILQICGVEVKDKTDQQVSRVGKSLALFLTYALKALEKKKKATKTVRHGTWASWEIPPGDRQGLAINADGSTKKAIEFPDYKKHPGLTIDAYNELFQLISSVQYEPTPFE